MVDACQLPRFDEGVRQIGQAGSGKCSNRITALTAVPPKPLNRIGSYVANFAKDGDPNGGSLPKWLRMTQDNKALMDLGDRVVASRAVPAGADAVIAAGKPPGGPGRGRGRGL